MIAACERSSKVEFFIKKRSLGQTAACPPKNFHHGQSARASRKMGERPPYTCNLSLLPGGNDPIHPLPLCARRLFNKSPFRKMNWKNVNMEVMDDILQSFVLQLVVVQGLQDPSTTWGHFFL